MKREVLIVDVEGKFNWFGIFDLLEILEGLIFKLLLVFEDEGNNFIFLIIEFLLKCELFLIVAILLGIE